METLPGRNTARCESDPLPAARRKASFRPARPKGKLLPTANTIQAHPLEDRTR